MRGFLCDGSARVETMFNELLCDYNRLRGGGDARSAWEGCRQDGGSSVTFARAMGGDEALAGVAEVNSSTQQSGGCNNERDCLTVRGRWRLRSECWIKEVGERREPSRGRAGAGPRGISPVADQTGRSKQRFLVGSPSHIFPRLTEALVRAPWQNSHFLFGTHPLRLASSLVAKGSLPCVLSWHERD